MSVQVKEETPNLKPEDNDEWMMNIFEDITILPEGRKEQLPSAFPNTIFFGKNKAEPVTDDILALPSARRTMGIMLSVCKEKTELGIDVAQIWPRQSKVKVPRLSREENQKRKEFLQRLRMFRPRTKSRRGRGRGRGRGRSRGRGRGRRFNRHRGHGNREGRFRSGREKKDRMRGARRAPPSFYSPPPSDSEEEMKEASQDCEIEYF